MKRHLCANVIESELNRKRRSPWRDATTIAVDLSKDVFEIGVEKEGRICERRRLRKGQMAVYFCAQPAATVVMEACGTSHHWGRLIRGLGHRVELLPAQHVSKCRIGEKTDRRDVSAILMARRRQDVVPVPVKSLEQQAVCSLHRVEPPLPPSSPGEPAESKAKLNFSR